MRPDGLITRISIETLEASQLTFIKGGSVFPHSGIAAKKAAKANRETWPKVL
jgi:hypothetical protein